MKDQSLKDRVRRYLNLLGEGIKLNEFLGDGTDGAVWSTNARTAVKAFKHPKGYYNERDAYERLATFGVTEKINRFWIPSMIGFHDELMVVEMDLMQSPPYIVDFAKVKIDRPPEFSEEVLADLERDGNERFEHNWPIVKSLMAELESYQIYYLDPKPGNIVFPKE